MAKGGIKQMEEPVKTTDPKRVVESGYDRVAHDYARLEGASEWPRMRWLKRTLNELARGVAHHGRSHFEVLWTEMRTIEGCRQRLEESRRMRLASLGMWPDTAHLENEYQAWTDGPMANAIGRFVLGLMHEESHLGEIGDIVRQARAARET